MYVPPKRHDHPYYQIWVNLRNRCNSPGNRDYWRYGGRGITVCERWDNDFMAFVEDMGPRPTPKHSVDRIDNNGPYSPGNCRWATQKQQYENSTARQVHSRLTEDDVRYIRDCSERPCILSKKFGVSMTHITRIINRSAWRHVP